MTDLKTLAKLNQYPVDYNRFGMYAVEISECISRNYILKGAYIAQMWTDVKDELPKRIKNKHYSDFVLVKDYGDKEKDVELACYDYKKDSWFLKHGLGIIIPDCWRPIERK